MHDWLASQVSHWRNSLTWRVIKNAGWTSGSIPINIGLGIVQTAFLARMLRPEGIGLLGLFTAVTAFFASIFRLNSAETILTYATRFLESDDTERAGTIVTYGYIIDLGSSILAYSALALFAGFFPQLFDVTEDNISLLMIYGLTLILSSVYWDSHSVLRLADRFRWTFLQSVAHSAMKTALVIALFYIGAGIVEVVWLQVVMAIINAVLLFTLSLKALKQRGIVLSIGNMDWSSIPRDVWVFEFQGYARAIVKSANRYVDTLLIGLMADPTQVGLYRASKQIANQLKAPAQGFVSSLYPEYSRLHFSGRKRQLRQLVLRFTIGFFVVSLFAAVILAVSIEGIIQLVLGPEFANARATALVLLQSTIIVIVMTPLYSLPAAVGRAGPALKAVTAALFVQALVAWFLVPRLGALGAAWATVAYVVVWALVLVPTIISVMQVGGDHQDQSEEVGHSKDVFALSEEHGD